MSSYDNSWIINALNAGGLSRAARDQRKLQRELAEREEGRYRWERQQALAEQQADEAARQARAQAEAEKAKQLSTANEQRYWSQMFDASRNDPARASRVSDAARARGYNVGTIVDPQTAQLARQTGVEIEDATTAEDAAALLGGQAAAALGAPAGPSLGAERTTPDIIEFERARPDLVGTPQYGPELEKWIRYRAASKSGGEDYATKLRKEFQASPVYKETQTIATAFEKVQAATASGPGDIGLIFGYMKMLDPNSTVREGEFATAETAGGVPSRIVSLYNKIISGERLPDDARKQFKSEAANIFSAQRRRFDVTASEYRRLAGPDAGDVVLRQGFGQEPPPDVDAEIAEAEGPP